MEPPKKKGQNSLISWSLKKEELQYQIDNYNTLGLWKSSRGASLLLILFSLVLTIVLASFSVVGWATVIGGIILYIPLGILIYKGYFWPNIVVLLLWTLDKGVQLAEKPDSIVVILVWWAIFMSVFYKSFQVEKARRNPNLITQAIPIQGHSNVNTGFCSFCGNQIISSAKFCTHCGKSLTI